MENHYNIIHILTNFMVSIRDGRIKVGDELVAINGNSLAGLQKHEAVNLLRSSSRLIQLVLDNSQVWKNLMPFALTIC